MFCIRLQREQNALARLMCTAPYRSSMTHLRQSLHWLPIRQRISYKIAMLTFKVWLCRQPAYLADLIVDYSPSRSLRFQGKDLLVVPRCQTQTASMEFRVAVPSIWNDLSIDIRSTAILISFRRQRRTSSRSRKSINPLPTCPAPPTHCFHESMTF